ncbi:MAG: hypothetical protein Q9227_005899 [Pyrenula ochraceoflavens]
MFSSIPIFPTILLLTFTLASPLNPRDDLALASVGITAHYVAPDDTTYAANTSPSFFPPSNTTDLTSRATSPNNCGGNNQGYIFWALEGSYCNQIINGQSFKGVAMCSKNFGDVVRCDGTTWVAVDHCGVGKCVDFCVPTNTVYGENAWCP